MKKVLCLALCVMLCVGIWSTAANAAVEGDFGYESAVGGKGIVNYYGDSEIVAIPDTIAGQPVRVIDGFKRKSLKEVIIPDTAWEIGVYAFNDCDNLESVTIPENVTIIKSDAFSSCDKLKDVKLNEGLVKIEESAFYSCDSLTELYIPKTVKSVGKDGDFRSAFSDGELKHLKITVDPENEYYMSDENGWVYTKDGKGLLMACNAGKVIEIPEGVTYIADKVFYNCNEIQEVVLPSTLEKIGKSAFAMCADIKKMELPDSLRYIDETAFSGCWWLTELTFGTKLSYIANGAFLGCGNLKKVTFLNNETVIAEFSSYVDESSAKRPVITNYGAFHLAGLETVYGYKNSTADKMFNNGEYSFVLLDEEEIINDEQLDLLSNLGIFEGYEDGDFKLDETLTRAQAAAVMVRLLNKENEAVKGETIFGDVDSSHWASGYIHLATEEGIINGFGDGTFAPEEKVTYRQFVKMLCCVLGYDIAAEARGGWANEGYISIAEDIRLTKGIECEYNTAITRGDTAKMIYNALEIELMDEDSASAGKYGNIETDNDQEKNIITVYFDYQRVVGVLKDATTLEVSKIYHKSQEYYKIGDCIIFKTDFEDLEKIVGKTVVAYVKKADNGENVLLAAIKRAGT